MLYLYPDCPEQSLITVESKLLLGKGKKTEICERIEFIKFNKGNLSRFRELGLLNCSNQTEEERSS